MKGSILAGYPTITTPKAPRAKRVTAKKAVKQGLPLCIFCRLRWVAKVQNLTCSVTCANGFRRQEKQRQHRETLTFPKEAIL